MPRLVSVSMSVVAWLTLFSAGGCGKSGIAHRRRATKRLCDFYPVQRHQISHSRIVS